MGILRKKLGQRRPTAFHPAPPIQSVLSQLKRWLGLLEFSQELVVTDQAVAMAVEVELTVVTVERAAGVFMPEVSSSAGPISTPAAARTKMTVLGTVLMKLSRWTA